MQPLDFIRNGVAVIPCTYKMKTPRLAHWQQYQHKLPTEREYNLWAQHKTNWGGVCGWRGLTVLDFDNRADYVLWLAWAIIEGNESRTVALHTYKVKTSRGIHVYLYVDDKPRSGHFKWGDIKGEGGYVLIPPSVHPSGHIYEVIDPTAPILRVATLDQVIPDAPQSMVPIPETPHVYPASSLWPQSIVDEIKERIPVLSLLPDAKPTGNHYFVCRCPFHTDHTPSMWVDTEHGICNCYKGCLGKPTDVIGLYARLHNINNRQAIKELAAKL